MPIDEPWWWYRAEPAWPARLLAPLSAAWGWQAERRFRTTHPYRSQLPVVCIGNLTAGGTGKTPLAIAVAGLLRDLGQAPFFLTRGYGGSLRGPHHVDPSRDQACAVGDEPLLLAEAGPVVVSRDRVAGARHIEAMAPSNGIIVMDDGLQNPGLVKDLSIAVVDARRGLGNGRVIPAGPLRAPLVAQLARVDVLIANRPALAADASLGSAPPNGWPSGWVGTTLAATTEPTGDRAWPTFGPLVAFAAIGAPQRFFDLLAAEGGHIIARRAFADHHAFTEQEANALLALARANGATLVTTAKDRVRLRGLPGARGELHQAAKTLDIRVRLARDDEQYLRARLEAMLAARRS